MLPHAVFLRWSSVLQCGAFFAVLSLYFLMPPLASPRALADPRNHLFYLLLPPYWFLGLFQTMIGSTNPALYGLAARALAGVAVLAVSGLVLYALAYARQMRRTVEQAGIVPTRHDSGGRLTGIAARVLARSARERGILAFIGQTLARSRQHRLVLAIYVGLALSWVFSELASTLYGGSRNVTPALDEAAFERVRIPLGVPLVLLFFVIIGLRVSFTLPVELRANWLFRITDPFASAAYLSAARKTLMVAGVAPVVAMSAIAAATMWPWWMAAGHCLFLILAGLLLIELALRNFYKVPFTCAWLPGQGNLKLMFGIYFGLILFLAEMIPRIEALALASLRGYIILCAVVVLAWLFSVRRGRRARSHITELRFEEQPPPAVASLGLLPRDG